MLARIFLVSLVLFPISMAAQTNAPDIQPSPDYSGGGGCVDSPENPTAVLALLGMSGAGAAFLRSKLKSR